MTRRRKNTEDVKRHQICLRLTDKQMYLLDQYCARRGFESEVDAVRVMIDGVEEWLTRQPPLRSVSSDHHSSIEEPAHSGPPPPLPAPTYSGPIDADPDTDVDSAGSGFSPSVGDFAGRPSVGLPRTGWNDGTDDD